ncbi:MAG: hypothetical protein AAGK24_05055, partial [Planctomycetota bacterium]
FQLWSSIASVLIAGWRLRQACHVFGSWFNCLVQASTAGGGWFLVLRVGRRWRPCVWRRCPRFAA